MFSNFNRTKIIFFVTSVILSLQSVVLAGTTPVTGTTPQDTSFHSSMEKFASSAAKIVPIFVEEFEKPFAPYLLSFAWLIAILCFLLMLFSHIVKNEGLGEDFLKFIFSSVFLFCILGYCGDIDGNGKFGDLVDYLRKVGNSLAYGEIDQDGYISKPSFIQTKLQAQKTQFDEAYRDFTNKSFTVKVSPGDSALVMPSDTSIEERLFVKYSDGYSPQKVKENLKPENWDLGSLFEWLNISRGIMELADLFLLILTGFLGSAIRLFFPIAVAVALHTELRGKTSMSFFWATGVITLVVPFFTQILRVCAYIAGNLAFQAATPTQDYFSFDVQNQAILAQGNPVYMIFLMCFIMCLTALTIFASPYLGFQVATGNIVNGLIGTVSGWFSGMASIGLNAVTSALAGSYAFAAKETTALRNYAQQGQLAADNRQIQYTQAEGAYNADVTGVTSSYNAANEQTTGQLQSSQISNAGNYQNTVAGIATDTNTQVANLTNDANRTIEQQNIDYNKSQGQTDNEWATGTIRNAPQIASIKRDQTNETISSVPVIGKVLDAAGINGNISNVYDPIAGKVGLPTTRDGASVTQMPNIQSQNTQPSKVNSVLDLMNSPNSKLPTPSALEPPKRLQMPKLMPPPKAVAPQMNAPRTGQTSSTVFNPAKGLGVTPNRVAQVANDEMSRLGYTPQARLAMLGNLGRENSWNMDTIFNGHNDPANGARNIGIISWQKERHSALMNHLAKDGFVQGGRVVKSEGSLRSMVRFMDNEMKTGKWGNQWQAMRNPHLNTQQVSGSLQKYILYSRNAKYNTPDANFDVANNAKWANKAYGLVKATSHGGGRAYSVNSTPPPQFTKGRGFSGGGNSFVSPNTVVSSGTSKPKTGNGLSQVKTLNGVTDTYAKALAPQMATDLSYANSSALNTYSRDANIGLTKQHSANSITIAQQSGMQKMDNAGELYANQNYASQVSANAGYAANYTNYAGGMERAGITYTTSTDVADMSYNRDMQQAQMQAETSIEAARLEAMSSFIQSMGGSVSHQLGEAFEKFNRF